MRRITAMAAVLLSVGLLSGCADATFLGQPIPHSTPFVAADATELLPTVWHVRDAAGAANGTYLRFASDEVEVLESHGYLLGSWAAQGDEFVVDLWGWSSGLHLTHVPAVPWLTGAVQFVRSGAGFALADPAGHTLARLVDDGPSPAHSDTVTTPEPVTSAVRQQLANAVGVDGSRTLSETALVGRWGVSGLDAATSELVLTARRWTVHGSCGDGTGTGGSGAYLIAAGGSFLVAADPESLVGCAAPKVVPPADAAALGRFDEARTVLLRGNRLTLFDRAGKRIGALVRLP